MTAHSKGHLVRCIPQYKQETWRPKPVLVSSALVFLPSRSQFCVIVLLCDVLCFSVVRVPTQLGKQQDHSRSSSLTYYCYGLVPRVMSFWLYSCFRSMLRSQNRGNFCRWCSLIVDVWLLVTSLFSWGPATRRSWSAVLDFLYKRRCWLMCLLGFGSRWFLCFCAFRVGYVTVRR